MKKIFIIAVLLSLITTEPAAQHYRRDTLHGMPASKFWGNSTYFSAGISFARNHEYEFNIGRSFGKMHYAPRGLWGGDVSTWGFGYSYSPVLNGSHSIKAFYEYAIINAIPLANYLLRGEYIYNITGQQHYLRPVVGVNLFPVTIGYHYSFLLNNDDGPNIYRHGLFIRLKTYVSRKNWFNTQTAPNDE